MNDDDGYDRPDDDLLREINYCRQAQLWASTTRTQWVWALEDIYRAATPAERSEAIATAKAEAVRLATIVARGLVGDAVYVLSRWINVDAEGEGDMVPDNIDTTAGLVEWIRSHGATVDRASNGERDGYVVTAREAIAYAMCREWERDVDPTWVEVDLLTGDVAVR